MYLEVIRFEEIWYTVYMNKVSRLEGYFGGLSYLKFQHDFKQSSMRMASPL